MQEGRKDEEMRAQQGPTEVEEHSEQRQLEVFREDPSNQFLTTNHGAESVTTMILP